ncbi:NAD-dependent epimerase/dehydratase family protein [Novosphingobium panipatense]|uniref:CDP-paratose 2-epimerase n=1 Tax=Novosphingobium panipatense TaxID=428991 RepID=A0ABY1PY91_9SPHN|nr:NAD-dependent epimerase/dehydratase family protein [Novosphingobium panipatense]SMP52832.1 CDP-paratose 2-epimerase [Novosphingobium panipatense]
MTTTTDRPILVTGGAGFIGCNLADKLAREGHRVIIYDALARAGVERNLAWLRDRHGDRIEPMIADIRDAARLAEAADGTQAIFHMAAQVAVTTSLTDPREDFDINLGGTFNVLEAARRQTIPVVFASTNKVYGDLADLAFAATEQGHLPADEGVRNHGIGEDRPLDFHTPYGCSKGGADQYVLDYARSYGVPSAVLRMSCIYGERQMGTEDQGWVAHFLIRALEGEPITLYGDGHQVRDILHVDDAVAAYLAAWQRIDTVAGRAFNLGGGTANAVSLRTLLAHIGALLGSEVPLRFEDWRAGDQRYFVADRRAVDAALDLSTPLPWREGVERLARWLAAERGLNSTLPEERLAAAPNQVAAL